MTTNAANACQPRHSQITLLSVVNAHVNRGWTFARIADEFGLTRCMVAGIIYRAKRRGAK